MASNLLLLIRFEELNKAGFALINRGVQTLWGYGGSGSILDSLFSQSI